MKNKIIVLILVLTVLMSTSALAFADIVETLEVESTTYELMNSETVDVDVKLSSATNIFAEDVTVQFDQTKFELVSETVNNSYKIMHTDKSVAGQARYIIAANDSLNGITGEAKLITLKFEAIAEGASDIQILSGLIADNTGTEITPNLLSKSYTVNPLIVDVNGDQKFTLADLAIAASLYLEPSQSWGSFTPDYDNSGAVNDADLSAIVVELLK